jgi:hypothetical protein
MQEEDTVSWAFSKLGKQGICTESWGANFLENVNVKSGEG